MKYKDILSEDVLKTFEDKRPEIEELLIDGDNLFINVDKIIEILNLEVEYTYLDVHSGKFDSKEKKIYVNHDEPFVRQRFTKAHEIGHFVLGHRGVSARLINSSDYSFIDRINEMAANQYAADLLMPMKLVDEVKKKYLKHYNLEEEQFKKTKVSDFIDFASNQMNVSKESLRYRLLNEGMVVRKKS